MQIRLFYHHAVQGVNKEIVELSTHSGTHCDVPRHFFNDGAAIDEVPLETYVGPATIVDLRGKPPGSSIERRDLEGTAFAAGDIVLLNTGWGHQRALTKTFLTQWPYLDGDEGGVSGHERRQGRRHRRGQHRRLRRPPENEPGARGAAGRRKIHRRGAVFSGRRDGRAQAAVLRSPGETAGLRRRLDARDALGPRLMVRECLA